MTSELPFEHLGEVWVLLDAARHRDISGNENGITLACMIISENSYVRPYIRVTMRDLREQSSQNLF
jgi:hypothetical protein